MPANEAQVLGRGAGRDQLFRARDVRDRGVGTEVRAQPAGEVLEGRDDGQRRSGEDDEAGPVNRVGGIRRRLVEASRDAARLRARCRRASTPPAVRRCRLRGARARSSRRSGRSRGTRSGPEGARRRPRAPGQVAARGGGSSRPTFRRLSALRSEVRIAPQRGQRPSARCMAAASRTRPQARQARVGTGRVVSASGPRSYAVTGGTAWHDVPGSGLGCCQILAGRAFGQSLPRSGRGQRSR